MAKSTRATLALKAAGIAFTTHEYAYDGQAARIGLQAAEALGTAPDRLLKTLMTLVDGKPVCVVLPSDREVSMKRLAAAVSGRAAQMMPPADAERLTGYVVGGISPLGQKRRVPVVVEERALEHEQVFVNGGQRGLQILIAPRALVAVLGAQVAPVVA